MKTRKNILAKVLSLVIIATFLLTLTPKITFADGGMGEVLITIGRGLIHLPKLFSDSKEEKSGKSDIIEKTKQFIVEFGAKKGNKIVFCSLYEKIIINTKSTVLTFNVTKNGKPTVFSLPFMATDKSSAITYKGAYLYWDDLAEYKRADRQLICDYFRQYCKIDLGSIELEIVTQKTATAPFPAPDIPISGFAPVSH